MPPHAHPAELDSLEIIRPSHYAKNGYPFEAWRLLREHAPAYYFDRFPGKPFWAITRHADIVWISRQPERFTNAPRLTVASEIEGGELPVHMLLNMDPPQHHAYRALVNKRFTPRAMQSIASRVDAITAEILDAACPEGEVAELDFVEAISARLPIWVIAEMLGVPREDWELLFTWTNQTTGAGDPEYQVGGSGLETMRTAQRSLFDYFEKLTEDRRSRPRDDLVSILTHAAVDGAPLPPFELLSYYFLLVVAGNETTRNATSGGLRALIEFPGELERVRSDPALLKPLVEEIVRWTSPVIHFCRTAVADFELHGQKISAGETLVLFYPSANRDAAVFDEPDVFRADRRPNRHIAFGVGEHFCLGAHVARLELHAIFRQLVQRMEHVEPAGPVELLRSSIIGGIKHMPLRMQLRRTGTAPQD